jgi:outer membrane protein OmpA-like peptidoglycan-associated protein
MKVPEGVVENQRVEITAEAVAILDTVKSTYLEEQHDAKEVRVQLSIRAEAGIKNWQVTLLGDGAPLDKVGSYGEPPESVTFSLVPAWLRTLTSPGRLAALLEVTDMEETEFAAETPIPVQVNFIKRQERLAQKMGYKVIEKYALVLFEFDRAEIKQQNQIIMNRIITRINELPSSQVQIIGHTDIIGTEKYNLTLSERRARAAYDLIMAAGVPSGTTVSYKGTGPYGPPYDNALPEGRAYNRTVVITVSYESNDTVAEVNN